MFQKFASVEVLEVKGSATRQASASLSKLGDFGDYRTDDGYMYVRVRAISSRVNKNHDGWPANELKKAYRSFVGKPIFVDHHNSDPKRARGVILDSALHIEDQKTSALDPYYATAPAEHLPPTWVELLLEVDAKKFPRLAKAIINSDIDGVSMGANVEMSKCSHCGNEARSPEEFCKHVQSKGAFFDYVAPDGTKTSKKSYEDCYDIGFFEISFVFDPADETALRLGDPVYAKKLERVAAVQKEGVGLMGDQITCPHCGGLMHRGDYQCPYCGSPNAFKNEPLPSPVSIDPNAAANGPMAAGPNSGGRAPFMAHMAHEVSDDEFGGHTSALQKGAPYPKNDDEVDHSAPGHKLPVKVNEMYNAIKRENPDYSDSKAMAIAWSRSGEKKEGANDNDFGDFVITADQHPGPQSDMIKRPDQVNTLRQEQICPICGSDMEDGICSVCNYEEPPEGFDNPDLEKAHEVNQQMDQDAAQQAQQGQEAPTPDVTPGPGGPAEPMPSGAMPATSSTANKYTSVAVTIEKTSAAGGRINTQERPILPATRQLSDKPIAQKTISEAKKPVESNTNKENMSQTTKTADGATPNGGSDVQADKRVDVEGVGAVTGDPLSGIEHENVEKDTGDFTAPHTDTWNGNEGDSLGQQDAVTSDKAGDLFTVSRDKTADTSDDLGGPVGVGVGNGGNAKDGGPTWDVSDAGISDSKPDRIDLNAPLKEEVGGPTETDSNEEFRSLKHTEPVTSEDANDLGGPIGVAVRSARTRLFKAMKVAEAEVEAGLIDADTKFDRIATLEDAEESALDARLDVLSSVKTAGLKKPGTTSKTAGLARMPQFSKTASFDIEAHAVDDYSFEDSIF